MKRIVISFACLLFTAIVYSQSDEYFSWKYYTAGSTGLLGDYAEAIWIDHDGNPYLAAYTPGWEEGGFSKYLQQQNLWINYSNVEYPVIGSIYDVGSSRISEIIEDAEGILWMATWRGILRFDPALGAGSLQFWGAENSPHPGGRTLDIDVAPDGTIWAAVFSVEWGDGGLVQFNPSSGEWNYWGYGITANNWPEGIPFCEQVAVQPKPDGGYLVWIDAWGSFMLTFDSGTGLFTLLPQDNNPGEVVALPGYDCVDDQGNLWALRVVAPGEPFSLDLRQPGGTWVTPPQPTSVINDIWAFKALGVQQALIAGLSSEIFYYNGNAWESRGIWREGAYTYGLDMDNQGNIWTSGVGGVAKRDAGTGFWQRHRITNSSQIDYWIEDLSFDEAGNVWMTGNAGPGVGGFQKFDGTRWTGFNEFTYGLGFPFPFPTDNTEAICYRHSNGQVVINPMFNYLHSWDGTTYSSLNYPNDRSEGLAEDSRGRLWSLGEYYDLRYYNDATNSWNSIDFYGWGSNIRPDPTREGTIWASSGYQVLRTDGDYYYSKIVDDFPELNPQSDTWTTVIPAPDDIAWVGTNQGLFKLDANQNDYEFFSPGNSDIPGENITPLAYTADGRLWFTNFGSTTTTEIGLCWFDGAGFGILPVEDGGLPHAQIKDVEVWNIDEGYELWMSCLSRGLAVLTVTSSPLGADSDRKIPKRMIMTSYPNPFSGSTTISTSQPVHGRFQLTIFDSQGRLIRTLANGNYPQGTSAIRWDGCDDLGNPVKPGIYIGRYSDGKQLGSVKIMAL